MLSIFALLLVMAVLQAKNTVAKEIYHTINPSYSCCKLIPGSIIENNPVVSFYTEISMQSFNPQSELKKTIHCIYYDIFQAPPVHFFDQDIIFKNASFPSTPLYISYCTILI